MRARTRARARATRKYNKTKYHRKKTRKSTRKKQKGRSRKGGMPPKRKATKKQRDEEEEEDLPTSPSAYPELERGARDIPPATGLSDAREQLKAELRTVAPMFREHYLKSDDAKASELQNYKDTQEAAQRRFAYEQTLANARSPMALNWAMKSPEEKERIYQKYKKQQEDALARL